jgi:FAD:protein FMN transferase
LSPMKREQVIGGALIGALLLLLGLGLWQTSRDRAQGRIGVARSAERVMGTTCTLAAVVRHAQRAEAERALRQAEIRLRRLEGELSNWLDDSEISRLNRQAPGVLLPLSATTMEVLRAAQDAVEATDGAFDVTCGPLIELWRQASREQRAPQAEAIDAARARSHWGLFELQAEGAVRLGAAARIDLGGIAKGYAVDQASAVLRDADPLGGLVDVGGDLLCFGWPVEADQWTVDVRNPFGKGSFCTLSLQGGAMCTSGDYARYAEINGRRTSEIIDPRSGRPVADVPSVTVLADDALTADIWATALSVLGEAGLARLPEGVDALLIIGAPDRYRAVCTANFRRLMRDPVPPRIEIYQPGT